MAEKNKDGGEKRWRGKVKMAGKKFIAGKTEESRWRGKVKMLGKSQDVGEKLRCWRKIKMAEKVGSN